jgi:acyl-coenzyme A thioesterase PaaI-like protein
MDFDALRAGMQQAIPFNGFLGLEIREIAAGRGVVALPDREQLRNHVGSQHAGALFAAGEAASGAAMMSAFAPRLGEVTPLAEAAEISYRAVARGIVLATAEFAEDPDELLSVLDDEGVVRFEVDVRLEDAQHKCVAEMVVRWHVRAGRRD